MTDLDTVRSWGRRLLDSIDWDGVFPLTLAPNGWPVPEGKLFQELARVGMGNPPFPTAAVFTAFSATIYATHGERWILSLIWQTDGVTATVHLNRGPLVPDATFLCRKHPEEIWT